MQTTDGGDHWVARDVGIDPHLIDHSVDSASELDFARVFMHGNADLGLFGRGSYDSAFTLGSTNGGDSWTVSSSGLTVNSGVAGFASRDVGWTTTNDHWEDPPLSMLQLTTDGGTSWMSQGETLTFGQLRAIDLIPGGGWLVGDYGAVFSYGPRTPSADTTAPKTVSDADHLWTNKTVVVTLTATDDDSGVAQTVSRCRSWTWESGPTVTIVVPPSRTYDQVETIRFRSFDKAGNVESMRYCSVNVDVNGPTTFGIRRVVVVRKHRPVFYAASATA